MPNDFRLIAIPHFLSFDELQMMDDVHSFPGGSALNTARVFQWMCKNEVVTKLIVFPHFY